MYSCAAPGAVILSNSIVLNRVPEPSHTLDGALPAQSHSAPAPGTEDALPSDKAPLCPSKVTGDRKP